MSLALFVSPKWSFQDDNGGNASGWKLYTYEPGTSTPKAAYQDSAGTTPHANPIVLDARGEAEIWLDGAYKFVLKNAAGVTKWTSDNVSGYGSGIQTGYLVKDVAGSANVALTASEQSNAVIEFTGELTGNINVTVGDDKDGYRWTLINSTTGSFTLTFKATSGTGAVIDQGAEAVVYHDGTNIVELLTVTAAGKALMDDATADAQLDTLGGTTVGKAVFTAADEAAAATAVAAIFPNYITGLIASNNATDANNDIDISAGACMDSTNAVMMVGSAMTKRLDAAWAAGTNQGGLDTGSKAINTEYYIHAIRKDSDASVDYLFSTSRTAPTMPAGYSAFRCIGWCKTDGSGNILGFVATEMAGGGLNYQWKTPVADVNLTNTLTTTARTDALSVMSGVKVRPLASARTYDATGGHADLFTDPDTTDTAPSAIIISVYGLGGIHTHANLSEIMTNTSRQIRARSTLATVDEYRVTTFGFIWSRR